MVHYWLAYLQRNQAPEESQAHLDEALAGSPQLVFPFRLETLPVLEWAMTQDATQPSRSWKTTYYLGTLYWSKHRTARAMELFDACGDAPDFAPFYVARASLREKRPAERGLIAADLRRATEIDADQWRAWRARIVHHREAGAHEEALRVSEAAHDRFPENYYIGLEHAAMLLENGQYAESARILDQARVLPHEGARRGHTLFEQTHVLLAIEQLQRGAYTEAIEHLERATSWPEHLGVGKPFNPDQRLQDYMVAQAYRQLGNDRQARARLEAVAEYTRAHPSAWGVAHYLGALALRELGDEAEADALLNDWQEAAGPDNLVVRWALAAFEGRAPQAQALAQALDAQRSDTSPYGLLSAFLSAQDER
jgi:tetratricopeptide (TPR) repeat protein